MIEVLNLSFIKKNQWAVASPTLQDNTSSSLHNLLVFVSCESCGYSFAFSLPVIHVHCYVPDIDPSRQPSIMQEQLLPWQQVGWYWFHTSPPVPPYSIYQFHPQLDSRKLGGVSLSPLMTSPMSQRPPPNFPSSSHFIIPASNTSRHSLGT